VETVEKKSFVINDKYFIFLLISVSVLYQQKLCFVLRKIIYFSYKKFTVVNVDSDALKKDALLKCHLMDFFIHQ